jgi:hypothetical protein
VSGIIPNILIMLPSQEIQLWQFEILQTMAQNSRVSLHILISSALQTTEKKLPLGLKLYTKVDEAFFSKRLAQENASILKSIQGLSKISIHGGIENLPPIDLCITLEPNVSLKSLKSIQAREYWFPEFSNGDSLPAFHEIWNCTPIIELRIYSTHTHSPANDRTLYQSNTAVHQYSYYATINACRWKLKHAFNRLLDKYLQGSSVSVEMERNSEEKGLNALQSLLLPLKIAYRFLIHKGRRFLCHEQFILAYRKRGEKLLSQGNLEGFKSIEPPSSEFWADPFLFTYKNQTYLFFEKLEFADNIGKLSVLNLSELEAGKAPQATDILIQPYHLSYPQIFEENGQVYMLPETTGNNAVELYAAEEFPLKWKKVANLLENTKAHDATLLKHEDLYWLFANMEAKNAPFHDELSLFFSESLLGNWQAHPLNPLVSNVEHARPAGRIHSDGQQLLRPSQDCSVCYGYGLNFNEISVLNKESYSERLIKKVYPIKRAGFHGIHAYDLNDEYEIVDIIRYIPKFSFLNWIFKFPKTFQFQFSFQIKSTQLSQRINTFNSKS